MVKIDRAKFANMVRLNKSIIEAVKLQLFENSSALQNFIDDSEFTGSAADNVKNYLQDSPSVMTEGLMNALEELSEKLSETLSSFDEVDHKENAVIGTQRLKQLREKTKLVTNDISYAFGDVNTAISNANEVGLRRAPLDLEKFHEVSDNLQTTFDVTKENIEDWDQKHKIDMAVVDKLVDYVEAMLISSSGNRVNDPAAISSYDRNGELGDYFNLTKYRIRDPEYDLTTGAAKGMPTAILETKRDDLIQKGLIRLGNSSVPYDIAFGGLYTSYKSAKDAGLNTLDAFNAVKGSSHTGAANTLSGTLRFAGNSVPYLSAGYTAWQDYKQDGNAPKALARGATSLAAGAAVGYLVPEAAALGTMVAGPVGGLIAGAAVFIGGMFVASAMDHSFDSPESKLYWEKVNRNK